MYQFLPDGTLIRIRPIRPADAELLQEGLARLSPRSVHRRFLTPKTRFSAAELRYLTEVDGQDHVAFVAERAAGDLIGVGRWVRLPSQLDTAEVAIVVMDAWHRRGVASSIGAALAEAARGRGVRRFVATMQADNVPAHRLMEKVTAHLEARHEGPLDELTADIAA